MFRIYENLTGEWWISPPYQMDLFPLVLRSLRANAHGTQWAILRDVDGVTLCEQGGETNIPRASHVAQYNLIFN